LQFIVAFNQRSTPASSAQFEKKLSELGGRAISYLPDDAVLALLPLSAVLTVGQLPGAAAVSQAWFDFVSRTASNFPSYCPGVAWVGEYQAEQRQSPELAALLQAVQQQGVQQVADMLQLAEGLSDMRRQSPAVELPHEPWHAVDTDHATDLAGDDVLLVSLDVMLVHQMIPLAAALSPQSKREAQARILQVVSLSSGTEALGHDAAAAMQPSAASR
jgi:hypothetical protein